MGGAILLFPLDHESFASQLQVNSFVGVVCTVVFVCVYLLLYADVDEEALSHPHIIVIIIWRNIQQ